MIGWAARQIARYFDLTEERATRLLWRAAAALSALGFVLVGTAIIAFEPIFLGQEEADAFQVGRIIQQDVFAPESVSFTSAVLTEQRRQQAVEDVRPIFNTPDPSVARQQIELARRILDFLGNIRADPYSTQEQKIRDAEQITALNLPQATLVQFFEIDDSTWQDMDSEILAILERVMRDEIKSADLPRIRSQLPTQVSVRFNDPREIDVVVSMVSDLLRANTTENVEATEQARQEALAAVGEETRSFEAGQLIIASGSRITQADYEVLEQVGLLRTEERQTQAIIRALLASVIALVIMGLYVSRFRPGLLTDQPSFLALVVGLFMVALAGARLGLSGEMYLYPAAALGLLYVAIVGAQIALIGMIGLAFLIGIMAGGDVEMIIFVAVGGIMGILNLRHPERLNSFFIAGVVVAVGNVAVVSLFNFNPTESGQASDLPLLIVFALMNGVLTAATAVAALYVITMAFNLPTALKLVELSQPNQPLLQRLLREAPGTYQHSLQVSNLCEQAANAIGANAELVRVAALYHDIGKMLNPVFFTENQTEGGNPHDTLNDPYRSADIIIGHVTEGDELARHYRLPQRIRDFIREHHGTSQVYVFYQQAIIMAGEDENEVDIAEFTYPGPRPRSREAGIMLLADGCEAAIRARQPKSKADIQETLHQVIDGRRRAGELNDSGLTLGDLNRIEAIFLEILQAIYHPRIDYDEAVARARGQANAAREEAARAEGIPATADDPPATDDAPEPRPTPVKPPVKSTAPPPAAPVRPVREDADADHTPLAEVPRLRKSDDKPAKPDAKADAKTDDTPPDGDQNDEQNDEKS